MAQGSAATGSRKVNPWLTVGIPMFITLFIAYLDRSGLSVALKTISADLHISTATFTIVSSAALTVFNVGYAVSSFFGGFATRRFDPKFVAISMVAVWSLSVALTGLATSIVVIIVFRAVLGLAEGVYWPQQSRIVSSWFSDRQLTRANSLIQYYGQFLSLATGFILLTLLQEWLGWRWMFGIVGILGLVISVPLLAKSLRREEFAPFKLEDSPAKVKLNLGSFGGPRFIILIVAYMTNGMLFWGLTLWLPLAVGDLGVTGPLQGLYSGLPYIAAVLLAVPIAYLSDRTGKRALIASLGLGVAGLLLVPLAVVPSSAGRLALITAAVGIYAASFTPNIWSIIQRSVHPAAIGAASGVVNGIGAGLGGVIAGWIVGIAKSLTGSYFTGFIILGVIAICGAVCLYTYSRMAIKNPVSESVMANV